MAYSKSGHELFLMGRDQRRLAACADVCRKLGAQVKPIDFDLRDFQRLEQEIEKIHETGALDLAIFNAGIGGVSSIDRAVEPIDRVREVTEVNMIAPLLGATLVAAAMAVAGAGRIVFIGSVADQFALPIAPSYSASKVGLTMFSKALRLRLRKYGVAVTLVSPGFIDTPMSRGLPTPRPFLISPDVAAANIKRKINAGRNRVVVPWQFLLIGKIAHLLPERLVDLFLLRSYQDSLKRIRKR